jgi:hypothetical protein
LVRGIYYLRPSKAVLSFTTLGPLGVETVLVPVPPGIDFLGGEKVGRDFLTTAFALTLSEKEGVLLDFFFAGPVEVEGDLTTFLGAEVGALGGAFGIALPTLLVEEGAVMSFLGPAEVEGDLTIVLEGALLVEGAVAAVLAFLLALLRSIARCSSALCVLDFLGGLGALGGGEAFGGAFSGLGAVGFGTTEVAVLAELNLLRSKVVAPKAGLVADLKSWGFLGSIVNALILRVFLCCSLGTRKGTIYCFWNDTEILTCIILWITIFMVYVFAITLRDYSTLL